MLLTSTLSQLLEDASRKLLASSDSAKLDAQVLLCHVLSKDISYLYTWPEKQLNKNQFEQFNTLIEQRLSGVPVAYITGTREFWSLPLTVSPSTLIPRPDTETLVDLVLNHRVNDDVSLLDLGTGTGAIALALASENNSWEISAVDFNEDAVELAKLNAKNLSLNHVKIFQSDWYSKISENTRFDVIVSNPPYIDPLDEHLAMGDVRFEPKSALVADNKGLADIELIIQQGKNYLNTNGAVYIEHGYEQGRGVRQIFLENGYNKVNTEKDLSGNDRITWAIFPK